MTKTRRYPPVEPLWSFGSVAHLSLQRRGSRSALAVKERQVLSAQESPADNGWLVLAAGDEAGEIVSFEVDRSGESPECVPWDSAIERQYGHRMRHNLAARAGQERVVLVSRDNGDRGIQIELSIEKPQ